MPDNMSMLNSGIGDLSGAVSSIFSGFGSQIAAGASRRSAQQYRDNAQNIETDKGLVEMGNRVKEFQANRTLENAVGSTQAAVAGNGFSNSGSGLDILRESATQGAITVNTTGVQDQMQLNDMERKAQAYLTEAQNAEDTAKAQDLAADGSFLGGALKGIGAVANLAPLLLL